ncbi:hypothetical protein BU606_12780 [Staphylococcus arlettae]|nr:hypothetical protein BU606_12780 [Staphylococcus arlettae]
MKITIKGERDSNGTVAGRIQSIVTVSAMLQMSLCPANFKLKFIKYIYQELKKYISVDLNRWDNGTKNLNTLGE